MLLKNKAEIVNLLIILLFSSLTFYTGIYSISIINVFTFVSSILLLFLFNHIIQKKHCKYLSAAIIGVIIELLFVVISPMIPILFLVLIINILISTKNYSEVFGLSEKDSFLLSVGINVLIFGMLFYMMGLKRIHIFFLLLLSIIFFVM